MPARSITSFTSSGGQDQTLGIVALNLHQCVVEIGMHGDGAVGGKVHGWSSRSRQRARLAGVAFGAIKLGGNSSLVDGPEAHVDGGEFLS